MPILCPGAGSLWKLGKHTRHGGQRSKSRHSSGSRPVKAKGTLAHTFTQKQVDTGPPMSPGSAGGVYLGPEKKERVSSTTTTTTTTPKISSAQEKKLAEIRSPTDYYTDGNVVIGQDVTKDGEDANHSTEDVDILHPMRAEKSYNDTLNPDGTLASIVFFEETFMSAKFSHLTTSSPGGKSANRSRVIDTTTASLHDWSGLQNKSSKEVTGVIPSWVRQRRYLPTLDEVDFDQIDIISLHSLPTNESPHQPFSPNRSNGMRLQNVDEKNEKKVSKIVNSKDGVTQPQSHVKHKFTDEHTSKDQRSVLGDLTNIDSSPAQKPSSKMPNQSAFYKIPKRASARERRSRRSRRISNSRKTKPNSSSRESVVNALDKPNEHTYVNLEYIAGIMTNSPPKDGSKKMNESIHDYESVWSNSPAKSTAEQRRMRSVSGGGSRPGMSSVITSGAKQSDIFHHDGRRLDGQIAVSKLSSKPDLFADLPIVSQSPRMTPRSTRDKQNVQGILKSYMLGIKETVERDAVHEKETRSSTSSWESATNSHSTEGEECAAILSRGAQINPSHQNPPSRTIKQSKPVERQGGSSNDFIGRNAGVRNINRRNRNEGIYYVTKDSERRLVESPSFADNAVRKARIVRTNSTEESSREVPDVPSMPKTQNKDIDFKSKKSSHIDYRRSLPATSTVASRSPPKTPQRRSTTNVRAVETKLSQKQNRKIRRTVEEDDILEAMLVQDQCESSAKKNSVVKAKDRSSESGKTLPGDPCVKDEMSRVQKIIEDWNKNSKSIARRHYAGGHIHTSANGPREQKIPQQPVSWDREQVGNAGVRWIKGARRAEQDIQAGSFPQNDPRALRTEVNKSSVRRIPTGYSSLPRPHGHRMTSPSVTEVYVTTQAYTPGEVDEVEAQRGEIVVVNSAMQRENDWMWVYVPRTDQFGYLPAFSARPLEFQVNEV
ncbi:uncharacterized protein LOC129262049 [Lytechinus pictus]|uniref:uncharacterized protein LOC129262049 n=1 Tax=Lytechinus pictus TaxID=7653 RepID=UPI0030BA05CF